MNKETHTRKSTPRHSAGNIFAGIGVLTICALIIWFGWGLITAAAGYILSRDPVIRAAALIAGAILFHASITKPDNHKEKQ